MIFRILCSQEAANLGTLMGGFAFIGTFIYGLQNLNQWRNQIQYGKKADWAEKALEQFESYMNEINHWFDFRYQHEVLDWQIKFHNMEKLFLKKAKTLANRLDDEELNQLFENLQKLIRHVPGRLKLANEETSVTGFHQQQKLRDDAWLFLNEVPESIEKVGLDIIKKLKDIILMNTKLAPIFWRSK